MHGQAYGNGFYFGLSDHVTLGYNREGKPGTAANGPTKRPIVYQSRLARPFTTSFRSCVICACSYAGNGYRRARAGARAVVGEARRVAAAGLAGTTTREAEAEAAAVIRAAPPDFESAPSSLRPRCEPSSWNASPGAGRLVAVTHCILLLSSTHRDEAIRRHNNVHSSQYDFDGRTGDCTNETTSQTLQVNMYACSTMYTAPLNTYRRQGNV